MVRSSVAALPTPPAGARRALLLAILLMTLGTIGAAGAFTRLSSDAAELTQGRMADDPSVDAEVAGFNRRLAELELGSVTRRAFAGANLLVCAMLAVASVMVIARRKSALWFTTQTLYANLLWTLGDAATSIDLLRSHGRELIPLLDAQLQAQLAAGVRDGSFSEADVDGFGYTGEHMLLGFMIAAGLRGLLMVIAYLWMLRSLRREDVRSFLEAKPER